MDAKKRSALRTGGGNPRMGIAWLMKVAASKNDPYDADFRHYVFENFDKLKAEEQKWLH